VLYELLTGTTPFDQERLKQVGFDEMRRIIREEEPPRPSTRVTTLAQAVTTVAANRRSDPKRLRHFLRGDLDWIVLKALAKDRNERYATVKELADDIERFLADRPTHACPPSSWYRFRKFARRNKGKLAVGGLLLLFLVLASSGVGWVAFDRAARKEAVEAEVAQALEEAQAFCRGDRLPDARATVKRAEALVGNGAGNDALARLLDRVRADLQMAGRLEEIRLDRSAVRDGHFDYEGTDRRYRDAFRTYGLDLAAPVPDLAAERIRTSEIRDQLLAAVDDWLLAKTKGGLAGSEQLQAVLRGADSDPWRSRFRETFRRPDKKALTPLARDPRVLSQPPATILLLGAVLSRAGEDRLAREVLRAAQERYPGDFWINHNLAFALAQGKPARAGEAVGYYRAALAVRPDSPGVYVNLGRALQAKGDLSGAVAAFRKAIALQPGYAMAHTNLGNALQAQDDLAGAIATYRQAIAQGVEAAGIYHNLGVALYAKGDLKRAVAAYRKAIALDPNFASAHNTLGTALHDQGKLVQAVAAHRKAIALDPNSVKAYYNLGNTLHDKGDRPGAIAAYRKAIALDPKFAGASLNLGWALEGEGKLPGALAAYRQAIALQPDLAMAHYNVGNVLGRTGDLAGSIAAFRKAIALDPGYAEAYCNLAAALEARGEFGKALTAMRRGHQLGSKRKRPPWPYQTAPLVRQYERLAELERRLPDFLAGKTVPAGADECLELARVCYRKRLYGAGVDFFQKAFATRPALRATNSYVAASVAALAGCGRGADTPRPDERECASLRGLALGWLRDELARWAKQPPNQRPALEQKLRAWQRDPNLAGVREPDALAKLPRVEREGWLRFWAKVAKTLGPGPAAPPKARKSDHKGGR
jgi:tetratricopeptide (TPR) repeat protein